MPACIFTNLTITKTRICISLLDSAFGSSRIDSGRKALLARGTPVGFHNFGFHNSLWICVRFLCATRFWFPFFCRKRTLLRLLSSLVASWVSFSRARPLTQVLQLWKLLCIQQIFLGRSSLSLTLRPVTFTIELKRFSLSDLAPNKSIGLLTKLKSQHLRTCWWFRGRGKDFPGVLFAMFVFEAIIPSACTSIARDFELEIWEQNYCLSTSGTIAHALLLANEMLSWNTVFQRSSFSRSAGQG